MSRRGFRFVVAESWRSLPLTKPSNKRTDVKSKSENAKVVGYVVPGVQSLLGPKQIVQLLCAAATITNPCKLMISQCATLNFYNECDPAFVLSTAGSPSSSPSSFPDLSVLLARGTTPAPGSVAVQKSAGCSGASSGPSRVLTFSRSCRRLASRSLTRSRALFTHSSVLRGLSDSRGRSLHDYTEAMQGRGPSK